MEQRSAQEKLIQATETASTTNTSTAAAYKEEPKTNLFDESECSKTEISAKSSRATVSTLSVNEDARRKSETVTLSSLKSSSASTTSASSRDTKVKSLVNLVLQEPEGRKSDETPLVQSQHKFIISSHDAATSTAIVKPQKIERRKTQHEFGSHDTAAATAMVKSQKIERRKTQHEFGSHDTGAITTMVQPQKKEGRKIQHEFWRDRERMVQDVEENKKKGSYDHSTTGIQPIILVAPEFIGGGVHRSQKSLPLQEERELYETESIIEDDQGSEAPSHLDEIDRHTITSSPRVTPTPPITSTGSLKIPPKRDEVQNLADLRKLALIKLKARRWMKLSGVGEVVQEKSAAAIQQSKRPQLEIPRALKLDIWKEAYPIVQKIHENYKLSLGEEDHLTRRAKAHLETHAKKFKGS